jgi:two-component system, NarL family, nitrate/nitrite response regulator NarL
MRIVTIDDHPLFREGVVRTLTAEPDLTIVGEGASAHEAVRLVGSLRPDILLLDLDIPDGGLSVLETVAAASPITRIIILTVDASEEHLLAALERGAMSYVLKGVTARELAKIIRAAHAGQGYVPPELAAQVLAARSGHGPVSQPRNVLDTLTEREQQILIMVRDGATNQEIAHALCLAEATVKNSMTIIMQKLQVRNRVEAAIVALRAAQGSLPRASKHAIAPRG